MKKTFAILSIVLLVSGCAGIRKSDSTFVAHAESFRLFGMPIPEDDQAAARKLVPAGATIETVEATPADWTSLTGILGNIFWIHTTHIGGTTK